MKVITTAELRKDASLMSGSFLLKKMKQGRDKLVDKQFVVIEVSPDACEEAAIYEAEQQISGM
ncbi:MAG: hypothetical protein AAGJ58_20700 [Pseudomonadota bacterium]